MVGLVILPLHAESVKITGTATCAKCTLKVSADCETVIITQTGGVKEILEVANNKVAKDFHEKICRGVANVEAEGEIIKQDGRKTITLTKIEVVKEEQPPK